MLKSLGKVALCLGVTICLHIAVVLFQEKGFSYGSYKLIYSYYGMVRDYNSSINYPHITFPYSQFDMVQDRVWLRQNLSAFAFKAPTFIDNRSRALFHANRENIGFLNAQPMNDFRMEVLLLRNGTFGEDKFCGYKGASDWIEQAKSGKIVSWIPSFIHKNWYHILVPLRNRDGNTFQHFTDHTLHRIIQILPYLQNRKVKLLMRRPRDAIVYDMLRMLRVSSDQLVFHLGETRMGADLMIHSCLNEPLHPTLWMEARRLLGVPNLLSVPRGQAYVVIVTRAGCVNCGRRLLNLNEISRMLVSRYGRDVVKVFNGPASLDATLGLFGRTRIIIGPHGGGLYNMNFAPSGTTVIEYMPTQNNGDTGIPGHQVFWKVANILQHKYWRVSVSPDKDKCMRVDVEKLTELLDAVDSHG